MRKQDIPNAITLFRLRFSAPTIGALYFLNWKWALLAAAISFALTDMLDGAIAKYWNWQSERGRRLDPIADKMLCWPLKVVVLIESAFDTPLILPTLVYLIYDIGGEYLRQVYERSGLKTEPPNWFARKKTFVLVTSLIVLCYAMIAPLAIREDLVWYGVLMYGTGAVFACISGIIYLRLAFISGAIRIPTVPAVF